MICFTSLLQFILIGPLLCPAILSIVSKQPIPLWLNWLNENILTGTRKTNLVDFVLDLEAHSV